MVDLSDARTHGHVADPDVACRRRQPACRTGRAPALERVPEGAGTPAGSAARRRLAKCSGREAVDRELLSLDRQPTGSGTVGTTTGGNNGALDCALVGSFRRLDLSGGRAPAHSVLRSEEHTSELQSLTNLVCRLLLEKKKN